MDLALNNIQKLFANGPGDWGSIPGGEVEQSKE